LGRRRGASIKRKDRDRADSLAEEVPIGFPAERAARIQFALVLISILDYETNSQSTSAANLFEPGSGPDGGSVGPQRFRYATVAGDTRVERAETCARVSFLLVASTSPRRSSPPVRRPTHHLKFLAVAKIEAARPVHLAEFLHLPEASAISLPTEKSSCRPPTTAWPPGAICRGS
jgi:hypothetical protein